MVKRQLANITRNLKNKSISITHGMPKFSLIWLHGMGGAAQNYQSFFTHSNSAVYSGCRVTVLQAPIRYVTLQNQQLSSWYDVRSPNRFTDPQDQVFNFQHVAQTQHTISQHINEEIQFWIKEQYSDYPASLRIFVGGMSQGGVMALHYGLSSCVQLGGVIALSSYLLRSTSIANHSQLPVFMVHGQRDTLIRQQNARKSYERLIQNNPLAQYRTIRKLGHTLMKVWLEGCYQHYCLQLNH